MCGRLRDPYPPSPLVRFRVHGSDAARRLATPPPTRTSVNPGSPPVPGAEPDRHRATSSPRRSWPGTASGAPGAVGARNGSQRVQPPSDVARPDQILLAGQRLVVRLSPTVADTLEFPDTEEVTGSNLVRPTRHFLFLALPGSALRPYKTALQGALPRPS
jgi:hypothetical protein